MPIQFKCSQCHKEMRAPDGTEGKRARCPSCSAITPIPESASAAFAPAAIVDRPFETPPADNPFRAPTATAPSGRMPSATKPGSKPSWDAKPSIGSFFSTSWEVLAQPTDTFRNMGRDGLGRPMIYGAIVGAITGLMLGALFALLMGFAALGATEGGNVPEGAPPAGILVGIGLGFMLFMPVMYALLFPVGALVNAGIIHVLLMIVGAKKYDYTATARCVSYLQFAVWPITLVMLIPFIGIIVAIPLGVYMIVVYIIALAEVHETTRGKVALAVLLPIIGLLALVSLAAIVGVFVG